MRAASTVPTLRDVRDAALVAAVGGAAIGLLGVRSGLLRYRAAALGASAAWLRRRSGSVWPAVALHWAGVLVWKTWLGGPTLAGLAGAESLSKRSPNLIQ
jgi:membrane protease YdiL (CAAX protease family)